MFAVEVYAAVRHFVFVEGNSRREAARVFGLSRETVLKMCRFSLPPGYTRTKPVKDYVRIARARGRETFVPLSHPAGHAQVDFGEAVGVIGGVRCKLHFFCMDLPQSDACFVKAYPAETTEAFLDGHVSAFAFFGGVPLSILYDNLKIAVAKICGDGKRERTRAFTELVSHYLFQDRFGRPGKGNDKGKVEGLVKYARSNFLTPIPVAASFDDLNAMLAERCRARQNERAGRHTANIGERLAADLAAFRDLPAVPLEPCEKRAARVSSRMCGSTRVATTETIALCSPVNSPSPTSAERRISSALRPLPRTARMTGAFRFAAARALKFISVGAETSP